mmetsp:Transcript_3842/g.8968  ORF Transcript_3842/g.8968 Transcript_3842/m.8968 type:complete len:235 (-) Transcript_3842:96-800(-)
MRDKDHGFSEMFPALLKNHAGHPRHDLLVDLKSSPSVPLVQKRDAALIARVDAMKALCSELGGSPEKGLRACQGFRPQLFRRHLRASKVSRIPTAALRRYRAGGRPAPLGVRPGHRPLPHPGLIDRLCQSILHEDRAHAELFGHEISSLHTAHEGRSVDPSRHWHIGGLQDLSQARGSGLGLQAPIRCQVRIPGPLGPGNPLSAHPSGLFSHVVLALAMSQKDYARRLGEQKPS